MGQYSLSAQIDPNNVFLVNRSRLDGRIDAIYISEQIKTKRGYNYPTIKLNKLVKSLTGGTPSKDNPKYWDGDISWVSPKDFKKFYIDTSQDTITESGLRNSSTKLIPERSVLLVVRSGVLIHTLPVAINTKPMAINQDIKALIPNKLILPEYLGYYFNVFNNELLPLIVKHSTTVQSVNTSEFDRLPIPVPPIIDQENIVNILNEAFLNKQQKEAEANALLESIDSYLLGELGISLPEQDNALGKRIFTSRFSEVTGGRLDSIYFKTKHFKIEGGIFENKKLKNLALILKGQSITKDKVIEGKFPVIAGGQTSPYNHNVFNHEGNVITISASGAYSGYVWYHDYPIFASDCCVIKPKNESDISTFYLSEILKLKQKEIYFLQQGAGQPHVYASDLAELQIPIPPAKKQIELLEHIQSLRSQAKALQEEAVRVLEEAKGEVERMIVKE